MSGKGFKKGDWVKHKNGIVGQLQWNGTIPTRGALWGLKLSDWNENGNDGSWNDVFYFRTDPGYGYFAPEKHLATCKPPAAFYASKHNFEVGDSVTLRNGKEGQIKYIGPLKSGKEEVIGIKLRNWVETGHNGKGYFEVPDGYGYFAKINAIVEIKKKGGGKVKPGKAKPKPKEESPNPLLDEPRVNSAGAGMGDRVRLGRGKEGIVRWMGVLNNKQIVGLELDQWIDNDNDGMLNGTRYFQCSKGRGYFAQAAKIADVLEKAKEPEPVAAPPAQWEPEPMDEPEPEKEKLDIAIGDKVELRKGRVGWVRYIGTVKGLKGEIIGLELLQWDQKGHNGQTSDGTKYFKCKDGTGYWTARQNVATVLESSGNQPVVVKKKKEETWTPEPEQKVDEDLLDFDVGDSVKLRKGREGTVRYYDKKSKVVGMELSQWAADASDGKYKNKEYFQCDKGRGYFTSAKNVKQILKRASNTPKRKKKTPEPEPDPLAGVDTTVNFKMGDKVELQRGRTGVVKFIGKTNFFQGTVVGLELDKWSEKGGDGTNKGVKYFECRGSGWGYFTKPSAIARVITDDMP